MSLTKQEEDLIKKNQKKTFEFYNEEDEKILNHQEYLEKQLIKARQDTVFPLFSKQNSSINI
jgi:hypothetical protein